MGASERRRGHQFERDVANDMKTHGFPEAKRHLEVQIQEANGYDIDETEPFAIQCKSMKKQPNIPEVFKEIKSERIPVVVFKVTGKGTYAAFKWENALDLMQLFRERML